MKISEMISLLETMKEAFGDLPVVAPDPLAPAMYCPAKPPALVADVVPGMTGLGGPSAFVSVSRVRVQTEFTDKWLAHVRNSGVRQIIVLS